MARTSRDSPNRYWSDLQRQIVVRMDVDLVTFADVLDADPTIAILVGVGPHMLVRVVGLVVMVMSRL